MANIVNDVQTNADTYGTSVSGLYTSQQGCDLSFVSGTLTINPALLTVTADAQSGSYGAANPALTGSVTGFVAGDTLSTATTGPLALTTSATASSPAGAYAIVGSGLLRSTMCSGRRRVTPKH